MPSTWAMLIVSQFLTACHLKDPPSTAVCLCEAAVVLVVKNESSCFSRITFSQFLWELLKRLNRTERWWCMSSGSDLFLIIILLHYDVIQQWITVKCWQKGRLMIWIDCSLLGCCQFWSDVIFSSIICFCIDQTSCNFVAGNIFHVWGPVFLADKRCE